MNTRSLKWFCVFSSTCVFSCQRHWFGHCFHWFGPSCQKDFSDKFAAVSHFSHRIPEWVENNIGVVDTSIPLPFSIDIDKKQVTLEKGKTEQVILSVNKTLLSDTSDASVNSSSTSTFSDIIIKPELNDFSLSDVPTTISIEVTASEYALSGTHKILLGAYTYDVAISQFITVTVV